MIPPSLFLFLKSTMAILLSWLSHIFPIFIKKSCQGNSLDAQWLGLQRVQAGSLVEKRRSHCYVMWAKKKKSCQNYDWDCIKPIDQLTSLLYQVSQSLNVICLSIYLSILNQCFEVYIIQFLQTFCKIYTQILHVLELL